MIDDIHYDAKDIPIYFSININCVKNFSSLRIEKVKEQQIVLLDDSKQIEEIIHDHGSMQLKAEDIYNLKITPRELIKENVRNIIRQYLNDHKIPCLVKIGTVRENKTSISCYGNCTYVKDHAKNYFFKITPADTIGENYKLCVTSSGPEILKHLSSPKFLQIRGQKRQEMQQQLEKKSVKMFLLEHKMNYDNNLAFKGNTQGLINKATAYKMKSEYKSANDMVKTCDIYDLIAHADRKEEEYIRKISIPMEAYLYTDKQIEVLKNAMFDMYFDATGTVVRLPTCHEHFQQRVYYYAGVIRLKDELLPVMELISCKHDTATLISFLITFKKDVQSMFPSKMKFFNSVTTDWSWPAINALTLAFNSMDFSTYLDNEFEGNKSLTTIKICYSHFMKIISDLCKKNFQENETL